MVKQDQLVVALQTEVNKLQEQLASELAEFKRKEDEMNAALAAEKTSRESADKKVVDNDNVHKEELTRKEADIAEYKKSIQTTQQEYDEYKDGAEDRIRDLETRIAGLTVINKKLTRSEERRVGKA